MCRLSEPTKPQPSFHIYILKPYFLKTVPYNTTDNSCKATLTLTRSVDGEHAQQKENYFEPEKLV